MARAFPAACNYPGCPVVTTDVYCDEHAAERGRSDREYNRRRDPEQVRFYKSARWLRVRRMFLRREPYCRLCRIEGRWTEANEVHHIKPRREGGTEAFENLAGLCTSCHSRITVIEQRNGWETAKKALETPENAGNWPETTPKRG